MPILPSIQREIAIKREEEAADEEELTLQTKKVASETPAVSPGIENQIHSLRGSGQPLSPSVRAFFEPRFGVDFSQVRIHSNIQTGNIAKALNARAFTIGQQSFFGANQYSPATTEGKRLLGHELTHVLQQERNQCLGNNVTLQVLNAKSHNFFNMHIYRKSEPSNVQVVQARQDVVIIVGRPSKTLAKNETAEEKLQMENWRSAAEALAPAVYEGLTVDKAFAGLKKMKIPIAKLYIIAHADVSGIGEINEEGDSIATTIQDVTKRIKGATGELGERAPQSVEMLSCFGGGSPKTMAKIGKAVGASTVRAPIQTTVISGRTFKLTSYGKSVTLTKNRLRNLNSVTLANYIRQTDALKYYDFVPGVPHPSSDPPEEEKLKALEKVLKKTGMIPFISYNAKPGEKDAVPYWKAPVERRKASEEEIPMMDFLGGKGVIEVEVNEKEEPAK